MGLAHLKPALDTVETSGGAFTVRGLGLADITALFASEREALSHLFDEVALGENGRITLTDMGAFAVQLTKLAPNVVTSIIALGADEPNVELAAALSFPVQVEALEKIGRLTFATEGSAKKVMETVIRMVKASRALTPAA